MSDNLQDVKLGDLDAAVAPDHRQPTTAYCLPPSATPREDETMRVRDVMTNGVIGVSETATLAEAVETLLRSRVSALFVFDANHALVGVLSEGDLLRRSELGTDEKRPRWLEFLLSGGRLAESYAHTHGRRVGEIMTTNVATVSEDAELGDAVDLMLHRRVKRLAVLRGDAVVGVIARSDLLKGLVTPAPSANALHPDAEIKAAIEAELDKLAWAPRASVRVEVAERRRHLRWRDHRRTTAFRPQGDRREHAGLRRRARSHVLDRAELGGRSASARRRANALGGHRVQAARKKATERTA